MLILYPKSSSNFIVSSEDVKSTILIIINLSLVHITQNQYG